MFYLELHKKFSSDQVCVGQDAHVKHFRIFLTCDVSQTNSFDVYKISKNTSFKFYKLIL